VLVSSTLFEDKTFHYLAATSNPELSIHGEEMERREDVIQLRKKENQPTSAN